MTVRLMIVGCDPSSKKLAFYALSPKSDQTLPMAFELRPNKERYGPRSAAEAGDACMEVLLALEPFKRKGVHPVMFIEEPVVGRGGIRSSLVQAYINGVVQDWFTRADFEVRITHQSTWKSGLGIPQQGGKDRVREIMNELYPADVAACGGDGDLLDAAALARYGLETIRGGG